MATILDNTPGILNKILQRKAEEISERKSSISIQELKCKIADMPPTRSFSTAIITSINNGAPAVIAELKKASPSKGIICQHFDPESIAQSYQDAGASCLSVLTDKDFFQGSDTYIQRVRKVCTLPILRKDFMIDPYQIYESRVLGADCILLIATALSDMQMQKMAMMATEIGMDTLIEVHNREELERGLMLRTPLIGINNRNLHTFDTNIQITLDLLPDVPQDRIVITESGIHTAEQVKTMYRNGINAFLVGDAFMNAQYPGTKLKELFFL